LERETRERISPDRQMTITGQLDPWSDLPRTIRTVAKGQDRAFTVGPITVAELDLGNPPLPAVCRTRDNKPCPLPDAVGTQTSERKPWDKFAYVAIKPSWR